MTYVVPENQNVAMANGITLACSVDPIMNHLNAMKRTSTDIVNSVDKNKEIIEACDSILEDINPTFKQTKDQDRKIKNLEEKVDRMGSSFDDDLIQRWRTLSAIEYRWGFFFCQVSYYRYICQE